MKNLKNLMPIFALILGLSLVFTQSAFKSAGSPTAERYWYYDNPSNDDADVMNHLNWTQAAPSDESTCVADAERPCKIFVDADDATELQSYLGGTNIGVIRSITDGEKF